MVSASVRPSRRDALASGHTRAVTSALLSEALAPLRADPARAAILLDIDGTLAPIVEHAADAHVSGDDPPAADRESRAATGWSPA